MVCEIRSKDGGCGYVEVECLYHCGSLLQRRLIREHEEEMCPRRPIEVQLSSSLRKIKGVMEENENTKYELAQLAKSKSKHTRRRE